MLKCFALVCILGLTVSAFEWDSAAQTGKKSQRMNLLSRTVGARMLAGTNGQMDSTFQTMNPTTGTNQQFVPIARQSNAAINSMTQTPTQTGGQVMDNSLTGGQQLTPDQLQQLQQFLSAQTQSQQQTGVQRQMTTQQTATPQQQPTQTFRMDTTGGMTGTTLDGVNTDKTAMFTADQQQRMTGGQFGGQMPTGGRMMPSTTPVTPMVVSTPVTMNQASKPSALEQQLLDQQILTQKLKEQLQQLQQQQQGRTFQQQQPVDTTGFGQTQTPQQTGRFQQTTDQTTGFGQTQTQTPQQTGRFQQTTDQTTGFGQTQTQTPQQTGRFQQTTDQTGFGQTQTPTTLTTDQQVQRMTAQQQQKQQQQLLDQINQLNQMNQARTVATPVGSPVVGMQQPTKMTPPTQTFMPTTNTSRMVTSQGMRPPTTGPMMTTTATGGFAGKSTARMGGDICASAKPGELLPHPLDETQFLVCNELGEITLMDCPNHTVFNPHLKLCDLTTDMPILCKSNPCLNGAKCVDVSPIEFRCECPQGFSGKTCEKFDTCSTSRPCGNDGVCLSFALGSPIPHVCLCNGGRSVGLMCDKGEQNPCTMPGSSTKLMPVNFNRAVFAHCEGARPHFKFCQPPLMFSASKQACEWSV